MEEVTQTETAVLGGGCFWCTEAVYSRIDGVVSIRPGYTGGQTENPTYKDICTGTSGHAEVIELKFDSQKICSKEILEWFWRSHDPNTLNRQGNDVGTQYRSGIFYLNESQRETALQSREEANQSGYFADPIVTEITELSVFYPAENYHHDYYQNNSSVGYCQFVIAPKLAKLNLV